MCWRSKAERMTVKSVSAKSEDKKKEAGEIYKDQKKRNDVGTEARRGRVTSWKC